MPGTVHIYNRGPTFIVVEFSAYGSKDARFTPSFRLQPGNGVDVDVDLATDLTLRIIDIGVAPTAQEREET